MFVKNLTEKELIYKEPLIEVKLAPFRVTYVSELVVSASMLKDVFGKKILILSRKQEKETIEDNTKKVKKENQEVSETMKTKTSIICDLKEIESKVQEALEEARKEVVEQSEEVIEEPVVRKKKRARTKKTK